MKQKLLVEREIVINLICGLAIHFRIENEYLYNWFLVYFSHDDAKIKTIYRFGLYFNLIGKQ